MEKRVEGIILQMHKRRLEYADQRGGGGQKPTCQMQVRTGDQVLTSFRRCERAKEKNEEGKKSKVTDPKTH